MGEREPYLKWLKSWSKKTGIPYDPKDPDYDYYSAYKAGVEPRYNPTAKQHHWPDATPKGESLKKPSHPTFGYDTYSKAFKDNPDEENWKGSVNASMLMGIARKLEEAKLNAAKRRIPKNTK